MQHQVEGRRGAGLGAVRAPRGAGGSGPGAGDILLVDVSNSFTKLALASRFREREVRRVPTGSWTAAGWLREWKRWGCPGRVVAASVVPRVSAMIRAACPGAHMLGPGSPLGVRIEYPRPERIGADRLANAAAAMAWGRLPVVVIDFGTAVTFDVVNRAGAYAGGVIAPGLGAFTDYLHDRTALLPKVDLREPRSAIGKSTEEAIRVGAVIGYRGLIEGILRAVKKELGGRRPLVVATGGDARLVAGRMRAVDRIDPMLTLRGLRTVAGRL